MARRRRLFSLLVLVALAAWVPSVGAHTQVQRATPGPGESVQGPLAVVELDFLDPVVPTPTITVSGPDGAPVPGLGETRMVADDVARVGFDPLTAAGSYRVDYRYVALDGAEQEGAHQFSFQPASDDGVDVRTVLAWVVIGVLVALLVAASLGRRRPSS